MSKDDSGDVMHTFANFTKELTSGKYRHIAPVDLIKTLWPIDDFSLFRGDRQQESKEFL